MATPTVSDNPAVQHHYAAQLGLTIALSRVLARINTPPGASTYVDVVSSLVREFQTAAIALAADYYSGARDLAGVPGAFAPPVIDPWAEQQIAAYFDTALTDLTAKMDRKVEISRLAGAIAIDAGTEEIFAAIDADPSHPRWARVTRPGACAFCLLLATKGAVYRSQETASFRPHRGCQCDVEVEFTKYEPPAHVRAAQSLYSDATADLPRGADRFNAFRRALYAERQQTSR